jgi:hypothetical protein
MITLLHDHEVANMPSRRIQHAPLVAGLVFGRRVAARAPVATFRASGLSSSRLVMRAVTLNRRPRHIGREVNIAPGTHLNDTFGTYTALVLLSVKSVTSYRYSIENIDWSSIVLALQISATGWY